MQMALWLTSFLRQLRLLRVPAGVGTLGMGVLVLLAGFVPGRTGGELRLPLGFQTYTQADRGLTRPLDTTSWMLRAPLGHDTSVSGGGAGQTEQTPDSAETSSAQWVAFAEQGVNILTASGPRQLLAGLEGTDLFQRLNRKGQGLPSGVSLRATVQSESMLVCVPLPGNEDTSAFVWRFGQRRPFGATVEQVARRFKLDQELIYAIMFSESGFNPRLISNRDAHGLMQVVPGSAGNEVHAYLHGRPGQPDARTLLNPETNILYGMTYYHLLLKRHMNGIKNPLSQEYCAVAAYNMGPNGLLKVFGASREAAFDAINALTSSEVYDALQKRLPSSETRQFLNKVISARSGFALAE